MNRPLDFLVLSDHAEYLGIADLLNTADPNLLANESGRHWYEAMRKEDLSSSIQNEESIRRNFVRPVRSRAKVELVFVRPV